MILLNCKHPFVIVMLSQSTDQVTNKKRIFFYTSRRLEQNFITELLPKAFSHFKRLRRIDLSNNNISRVAHDAFAGLKSLTTL